MFKIPIFKILYFRILVAIVIIISLTVVRFVFSDVYKEFTKFYKTQLYDQIDIKQVTEEEQPKTPSGSEVVETSLTGLSGNMKLDMVLPVDYQRVSSDYGYRYNPVTGKYAFHDGLDFAASSGENIVSVADGVVVKAKYSTDYGYFIKVDHGNGLYSFYAHCSELLKEVGDEVKKGDTVALVGSTGRSTGPHLHFEIIKDDVSLNPSYYIPISIDG